jgi:drug/metabolite transporter (DMT)-like permease
MGSWRHACLFAGAVFLSSCAQVLLKKAANKHPGGFRAYLNPETILGYAVFFGMTWAAVFLYRYIELSAGALLDALSYVFIPLLSFFFLGEKIGKRKMLGFSLIVGGIVIYAVWGGLG